MKQSQQYLFLFILLIYCNISCYNEKVLSENQGIVITLSSVYLNLDTAKTYELPVGITSIFNIQNKTSVAFNLKSKYHFNGIVDSNTLDHFIIVSNDSIRPIYSLGFKNLMIPKDSNLNIGFYIFTRNEYNKIVSDYNLIKHYKAIDSSYRSLISESKFYFIKPKETGNYKNHQEFDTIEIKVSPNFRVINGVVNWDDVRNF